MNWLLKRLKRGEGNAPQTIPARRGTDPTVTAATPRRDAADERAAAAEAELERMKSQLRAAEESQRRAEQQRRRLEGDLRQAQKRSDQETSERRRLEEEMEKASQGRLWAWAEQEVQRLQASLKKARERLYETEEELHRTRAERESNERRSRIAEDEAQRLRDELRQLERTVAAERQAAPGKPRGNGKAAAPAAPAPPAAAEPPPAPAVVQGRNGNGAAERLRAENLDLTVDWNGALAGVDGDIELLRVLARAFQEDAPLLLGDLRVALDDADWDTALRTVHTLRGALGSLGAVNARQVAQRLEASLQARTIAEVEECCVALQLEIERLRPLLTTLRSK